MTTLTHVLKNNICHASYRLFLEKLLKDRPEQVDLYCAGSGGNFRDALAISGLLRSHGNVRGFLAGCASSGHSVIFAACQQRYLYPDAYIEIHPAKTCFLAQEWVDAKTLKDQARMLEQMDKICLDHYVRAARVARTWWETRYYAGRDVICVLDYQELIDIGFAAAGSGESSGLHLRHPSRKRVDTPGTN